MTEFKNKWVPFISGAAAGVADTVINYYPYGLHYRLQQGQNISPFSPHEYYQGKFSASITGSRNARYVTGKFYPPIPKPHPIRYWMFPECFRGIRAYSAIIPITCICDGMTDWFKVLGIRPELAPIASGMIAALMVSAPIGNMINMDIKLKEQNKPAGTKNTFNYLMSRHGLKGFYVGLGPLICREAIYSWSVFYAMRQGQERFDLSSVQSAVLSGTLATILSQPNDTMATYSQANRLSVRTTVSEMWKEAGVSRFYRGFMFRWYAVIAGIYVMDNVSNFVKTSLQDSDV